MGYMYNIELSVLRGHPFSYGILMPTELLFQTSFVLLSVLWIGFTSIAIIKTLKDF